VYAEDGYGPPRTWFATEDEANACLEFVFNVEDSSLNETKEITATRSPAVVPTEDFLATTSQLPNMDDYATKTDMSNYRQKLDLSVYAADQTVIVAPDGSVFLPTTPTCSIDGHLAEREWVNGDTRIGWWGYVGEEELIRFAKFDAPDFTSPVD
jgi:hypothetical protein